jgi:WD40 repeat protein
LLSAANDGLVKIWNFNNGSLLRTYTHNEDPLEISRVFYVQDEKRGQECVYAAGWNRKVFIWEDADEVLPTKLPGSLKHCSPCCCNEFSGMDLAFMKIA